MKINTNHILVLLLLIISMSGCKTDKQNSKYYDLNALIIERSNYCDAFEYVNSVTINDTFKIYFSTDYDYLNTATINQHCEYLMQDLLVADYANTKYISCNFNHPKRDPPITIVETNHFDTLKLKLGRFTNNEFKRTINKLYVLDSEYNHYNLIEVLNREYNDANDKFGYSKFDLYGEDVFILVYNLSNNCKSNSNIDGNKVKNEMISNMRNNSNYGNIMVEELENIFNDICKNSM